MGGGREIFTLRMLASMYSQMKRGLELKTMDNEFTSA